MTSPSVTESKKVTHDCQQPYKYAIDLTFSVDFVKARPPPTGLGVASRCIEKAFALIVGDRRHESTCANMVNFSPFPESSGDSSFSHLQIDGTSEKGERIALEGTPKRQNFPYSRQPVSGVHFALFQESRDPGPASRRHNLRPRPPCDWRLRSWPRAALHGESDGRGPRRKHRPRQRCP
jgi:hypothetical protein